MACTKDRWLSENEADEEAWTDEEDEEREA